MLQHFSQQACFDEAPPYNQNQNQTGVGKGVQYNAGEGYERLLGGCGSAPSRLAGWAPVA